MTQNSLHALVTGGAGFLGSHLVDALASRGTRVTVLDDLSAGRETNLESALGAGNVRLVVGSMTNPELVDELVREVDIVYHLGAIVGVDAVLSRPVETMRTNSEGTYVALSACTRHAKRVLLASSSEVYGKAASSGQALREDDSLSLEPPTSTRWGYSAAKMADEHLAVSFHKELGLRAIVIRPFNVIGARQLPDGGAVLPRFAEWALREEPLLVYGDGTQSRSFTHVAEVVRAILALTETSADFGVFNVGSDKPTTILDLAQHVLALTGSSSSIQLVPHEEIAGGDYDDVYRRLPDLTRLRDAIGFVPRTDIEAAVHEVLASARARLDLPVR